MYRSRGLEASIGRDGKSRLGVAVCGLRIYQIVIVSKKYRKDCSFPTAHSVAKRRPCVSCVQLLSR